MSSTPLDLPVLISQLHYVARIAHVEKATPDMQQQLYNPLVHENLQRDQSKVQQVNKKTKSDPVDRDGRQEQQQAQSDRKKRDEGEKEETETSTANPSPWSGNIVNVKI